MLRSTQGDGEKPIPRGGSKVGGLYLLQIAGTPDGIECLFPSDLLPDEREVLSSLLEDWSHADRDLQGHLNVVSADFVGDEQLNLFDIVMAMNTSGGVPDRPSITGVTENGIGQVSVAFSTPDAGTAPITSYTVTVACVQGPTVSATGPSSPITVGLVPGQYRFSVAATNAVGPGMDSVPLTTTVGSTPPTIDDGPAPVGTSDRSTTPGFLSADRGL